MGNVGRIIGLVLSKLSLIAGLYIGYTYHSDIDKVIHYTVEKNVPIDKNCYSGIGEVNIYYVKKHGEIIPSYGTIDYKIPIGKDIAPVDMYSLQMKRIKEGKDIKPNKIVNMLDYIVNNSSVKIKDDSAKKKISDIYYKLNPKKKTLNYLNMLNLYMKQHHKIVDDSAKINPLQK